MKVLTKEDLATRIHVKNARNLFVDVAEAHGGLTYDKHEYDILNYPRIVKEMYDFIDGYIRCKASGNYRYKDSAIGTTVQFYNNMFVDKKYRRRISLNEMNDLIKGFLEWTDRLQTIMDEHLHELGVDTEMKTMFELTNNQYRKLAKVNRDDMEIYLWLLYQNKIDTKKKRSLPSNLKIMYENLSTPVMYEIKKG